MPEPDPHNERISSTVPDHLIPIESVSTPTTERLRQRQQRRIRNLYLPGIPASVCARAFAVSPTAAVLLQVIGLHVRLNRSLTVSLRSSLVSTFGIGDRQRRRALRALTMAGLIAVEMSPGKRSIVTVTDKEFARWLLQQRP